jgi:hypothetical protein
VWPYDLGPPHSLSRAKWPPSVFLLPVCVCIVRLHLAGEGTGGPKSYDSTETLVLHIQYHFISNSVSHYKLGSAKATSPILLSRVRPFRLKIFFASKRIVSEQRSVSHEIRLFASSIRFPFFRFFRLFSLQFFRNYSL